MLHNNSIKQSHKFDFFIILTVLVLLFTVSLATKTIGAGDNSDYAGVAKFFAGELHSNIRSSHSYFYGLFHHPLILLTHSFFALKIASLIYLTLIILSVYYASGRNRKTLLLILLSPVIWYMGPWINPMGIASLLFFWTYYFIKKYSENEKLSYLIVAGLLAGLAWCFWDAMLFFIIILGLSFLYNKKLVHSVLFAISLAIGLSPKLIMDQLLFGSFVAGVLRATFATFTGLFLHGIYKNLVPVSVNPMFLISLILLIPFCVYKIFSRQNWDKMRSSVICISLLLLMLLFYAEIRYLIILAPIILFEATPLLSKLQLRRHLIISLILILFVITPYIIQINYSTNAPEFKDFLRNGIRGNVIIDNSEKNST